MITETEARPAGALRLGELAIDRDSYRATLDGRVLPLSRSQFDLLALLVENRHRVLPRADLAGALGMARERSVDVLLSALRTHCGQEFVRNVRNRGWIIEPGAFETVEPDVFETVEPDVFETVEPDVFETVEPDVFEAAEPDSVER